MRSINRRDLLKSLGGAAALALTAACSQTAAPAPTTGPSATVAPAQTAPAKVASTASQVSITFWDAFTGHNADVCQQLVDRFNQSQKDVVVTLENQNDYATLANKFTTALQAHNAPEVVLLSDVWWFKFYLAKSLVPLDDLMKAENISPSDYVDVFFKETVRAGKQVVLPFARSTPIFYYNKDAWAKAGLEDRGPKTWDEFVNDFAPKLKSQGPTVLGLGGAASYAAWVFQGVEWAHGGAYSDPDFTIRIQEPNSVKAGELWRSMVTSGIATASQDPTTDFKSGASLAYLDSTASLAGNESAAKFKVGTAFLPEGPSGFGCCTGGAGLAMTSATAKEKQQAAMKFIAFATGTDTVFWSQNTGEAVFKDVADQLNTEKQPVLRTLKDLGEG